MSLVVFLLRKCSTVAFPADQLRMTVPVTGRCMIWVSVSSFICSLNATVLHSSGSVWKRSVDCSSFQAIKGSSLLNVILSSSVTVGQTRMCRSRDRPERPWISIADLLLVVCRTVKKIKSHLKSELCTTKLWAISFITELNTSNLFIENLELNRKEANCREAHKLSTHENFNHKRVKTNKPFVLIDLFWL